MKINLKLVLMIFLSTNCTKKESDIEKLKGVWQVANKETDAFSSLMGEILAPPVLEIIDETNCQLTFLGVRDLGKMIINEEDNIIKLTWEKSDIELKYNLKEGEELIKMAVNNDEYLFKKIGEASTIKSESIEGITIDGNILIGTWKLTRKKGGGSNAASDFMLKESGALYNFMSKDQIEIEYRNGDFERGYYYVKDNKKILIAIDEEIRKYECILFTNQEIRLKNESNNAVITLSKSSNNSINQIENRQEEIKEDEGSNARTNNSNSYVGRYQKLRSEIVDNYDKYIKVIDSRKTGNLKAFAKLKEDLKFIKENETLEEFIEECPRIESSIVKEYLDGMEVVLRPIRRGE